MGLTGRVKTAGYDMAIARADTVIRHLVQNDLPSALAIQTTNYPAFLREDSEAFASRLTVLASYCLAAVRGERLIAYLLAHGWATQSPPPVGTILNENSGANEVLFIHDLAVSAAGQGSGCGRKLIDHAFALASRDGFRRAELIAVEGAASYWRTLGFAEDTCSPSLTAKVAGYGADARWMTRAISIPDLVEPIARSACERPQMLGDQPAAHFS
jgi:GNAT superfamily N-acetyltransferase